MGELPDGRSSAGNFYCPLLTIVKIALLSKMSVLSAVVRLGQQGMWPDILRKE